MKVETARNELLKKYLSLLKAFEERLRSEAYASRIQAAEAEAFAIAESSPVH